MEITNELQQIIYEKIRLFLENSYYENQINFIYNEISKNNYEVLKTFTYQDINYLYYLPNKTEHIKKLFYLIKLWATENDKVYFLIDHEDEKYDSTKYKELYNQVIKEADMDTKIYKQFDIWSQQDTFINQIISKIIFYTPTSPLYKFEEVFLIKVLYKCKIHFPNKTSACENYIIEKRLKESNYKDLLNYTPLKGNNKNYLISIEKKPTNTKNKYLLDLITQWENENSPLYLLANKYLNQKISSDSFYEQILLMAKEDNNIYKKFDNWVNQSAYLNYIIGHRINDFIKNTDELKEVRAILNDFFNHGINTNNDSYFIKKSDIHKLTIRVDKIIQSIQNDKENKKQYFIDTYTLSLETIYQKLKQKEDDYLIKLYHHKIRSTIKNFIERFKQNKLTKEEEKYLEFLYKKNLEDNQIIQLIKKDSKTIKEYITYVEKKIKKHLVTEGFIDDKRGKKYQEVSITDESIDSLSVADDFDDSEDIYTLQEFYSQANEIITEVLLSVELSSGKKREKSKMTQEEKKDILNENIIIMKLYFNQSKNMVEERASKYFDKIEKIYNSNNKEALRKRAYKLRNTLTRRFLQAFSTFYKISLVRFDKCMISFINTTYTEVKKREEKSKKLSKNLKVDKELVEKFVKMILEINFKIPNHFYYNTEKIQEAKEKFNKVLEEKTSLKELQKEQDANT